MDRFIVGQSKLSGKVRISGSKNASLPIMAATILTDEDCIIHEVPDLMDIRTMIKILSILGKRVVFADNTLVVKSTKSKKTIAPYKLVRTMRASFCCIGPLLAKRKKARVALPGGCVIGPRPVDLHMKGLASLGADIAIEGGYCEASLKRINPGRVYLGGPFGSSVLATANVVMASVFNPGEVIIEHAACEPEIKCLIQFIKTMGADISGEGTPLLKIKGVRSLKGCEFSVIPDRIEAGTFIAAALATKSHITIEGARPEHLTSVLNVSEHIGARLNLKKDSSIDIRVKHLKPVNITTLPYPGFPTDLQAQFMSCLCLADGTSLITEKIYPDRFMHVAELNRMGAAIQRSGPYAIIEGKQKLYGAETMASDLRASAALLIGALAAKGRSHISRVYHIDRGYENIENKFHKLGAKVKRIK